MRRIAIFFLLLCSGPLQAQWLPDGEQQRLRAMWEASGVEFPEGGRFYELPRVSQAIAAQVGVGDVNGIYDANYDGPVNAQKENINRQMPWATPAGLHWSPKNQWTKATLAYFPGTIDVFREPTQVENGFGRKQTHKRISWRFPPGTLFAEMLIRRHQGREFTFEIRERVKNADNRWGSGTTYRPNVPLEDGRSVKMPPGKLADFGVGFSRLTVWEAPRIATAPKLFASRTTLTAHTDDAIVPRNYYGTHGLKCMECHSRTGESVSYGGTNIPGSDTIISFHPFTMATLNTSDHPQLDTRWPVQRVQR